MTLELRPAAAPPPCACAALNFRMLHLLLHADVGHNTCMCQEGTTSSAAPGGWTQCSLYFQPPPCRARRALLSPHTGSVPPLSNDSTHTRDPFQSFIHRIRPLARFPRDTSSLLAPGSAQSAARTRSTRSRTARESVSIPLAEQRPARNSLMAARARAVAALGAAPAFRGACSRGALVADSSSAAAKSKQAFKVRRTAGTGCAAARGSARACSCV